MIVIEPARIPVVMEKERTAILLSKLVTAKEAYEKDQPGARAELIALNYQLAANLELPSESISRMTWAEVGPISITSRKLIIEKPGRYASCVIAIDLGLFKILAEDNNRSRKVEELAGRCNAEPTFLARFLKHLAAMNILHEDGCDTFSNSSFATALTQPALADGMKFL